MKYNVFTLSLLAAMTAGAVAQGPPGQGPPEGPWSHHHHSYHPSAPGQPTQPAQSKPSAQQPAPSQPPQQSQQSQQQPPAQQSSSQETSGNQPKPTHSRHHSSKKGSTGGAPAPTSAPGPAPSQSGGGDGGGKGGPGGGMTVVFENKMGKDIFVSYGHNAGGPGLVASPTPGNMGQSTKVVMPSGWAGRVYVDTKADVNPLGTKFEGSTTGAPDIDVSYVDGYNVPMTCSVDGEAVTGCNIDLYAKGSCPDAKQGDVCVNPSNTVEGNGPAPPFFAPCVGSAYTFPNDNAANVGDIKDNYVTCCIGTNCPAPARQGKMPNQPSKRSIHGEENQVVDDQVGVRRRSLHGGSLLARNHRHAA